MSVSFLFLYCVSQTVFGGQSVFNFSMALNSRCAAPILRLFSKVLSNLYKSQIMTTIWTTNFNCHFSEERFLEIYVLFHISRRNTNHFLPIFSLKMFFFIWFNSYEKISETCIIIFTQFCFTGKTVWWLWNFCRQNKKSVENELSLK